MNRTRMLVVAFVAFGLSVIVTFAVYRVLKNRLRPSSESVEIIVAAEKLPLGTRLTPEKLATVSWPKGVVLEGSFKSIQELEGRGVVIAMLPNEPILESKLAPKGAGAGLMAAIPEGMRAVAVKVNDVIGVAGFVVPGTRVDVILSGSSDNTNKDDTAKVILENVQVLAAGQNVEQTADGKPQSVQVVTLLVSPEDSQKLALASIDGKIQLALRNPLDFEHADPSPVNKTALYKGPSTEAPAPPPPPPPKKIVPKVEPPTPPPAPAPPSSQKVAVELIQGTSEKTLTFEVKPDQP
jgi:pilus assembly protein CpaB